MGKSSCRQGGLLDPPTKGTNTVDNVERAETQLAPYSSAVGRRLLILAVFFSAATIVLAACQAGCATVIVPPATPTDPAPVVLVDYGRHTSLVLPRPEGRSVEYAYGEWGWFALDRTGFFEALGAMLLPTQGALGRAELDVPPDPDELARFKLFEDAILLEVAAADAASLTARLDERFARQEADRVEQPRCGLAFVPDDRDFHLFHTCNRAVADWLEALGCEVRGAAILGNFRIE